MSESKYSVCPSNQVDEYNNYSEDDVNSTLSGNSNEDWNELHQIAVHGNVQDFKDWIKAKSAEELQKALIQRCEHMHYTPLMVAIDHVVIDDSDCEDSDNQLDHDGLDYDGLQEMASREERTELIQLMLEYDANPNGYRKQDLISRHYEPNHTPLSLAASKEYLEIIPMLVSYGGNLEGKASVGQTALHEATEIESIKGMSLLLNLKADVNGEVDFGSYNVEGFTALHIAVSNRHSLNPKAVDLLLDKRANVDAKGINGATVLDVAISHHKKNLLWRIRQQYLLFVECYSGMIDNHIARFVTDYSQVKEICQFL